jgi:hypothetical protein
MNPSERIYRIPVRAIIQKVDLGDSSSFFYPLPLMNPQTLSLVLLGVCLCAGAGLFIGGCDILGDWLSMLVLIPVLLALLAAYGCHRTSGDSYEAGWVSFDSWVFILAFMLTWVVGVPAVVYHTKGFAKPAGLGLSIGGCVLVFVGLLLTYVLPGCSSEEGWTAA